MEQIRELKSLIGDSFLTLPLLLISFLFFFGTMTSNVGMLYLFLGHLIIAPALSFLSNEKGPLIYDEGKTSIPKALKWLFSMLVFLNVNSVAVEAITGSKLAYILNFLLLIPGILQFVFRQTTPFFYLNTIAWFLDHPTEEQKQTPSNCSMLPGYSDKESKYVIPSTWTTHLTFFFGFIMANATLLLAKADPVLSSVSKDEKEQKRRQDALDERIRNRKWIAGSILAACAIVFVLLLLLRYKRSSCEYSFLYSLTPIFYTFLTGISWFGLVYSKCGIQPADILGIVQGFIDQDLVDNPIVCVGS